MGLKQFLKNGLCIYILSSEGEMFIVAVYVDDLIVASKSSTYVHIFLKNLSENCNIKDMGKLHLLLGIKVVYPGSEKIWIGEPTHTAEVLKSFRWKTQNQLQLHVMLERN